MTTMHGLYAIQRDFEIAFQECVLQWTQNSISCITVLKTYLEGCLIQMVTLPSSSGFPPYNPPPCAFGINEILWVKLMPASASKASMWLLCLRDGGPACTASPSATQRMLVFHLSFIYCDRRDGPSGRLLLSISRRLWSCFLCRR